MARFSWSRMIGWDRHPAHNHREWSIRDSQRRLLPLHRGQSIQSAIPAPEVTKVALRLRHLIQECVPCELEDQQITRPHSKVITQKVIKAAKEAGGTEYGACVVYCLLVAKRWFRHQALCELWDAGLHELRATACEVIAKQIIETEDDMTYMLHSVLLKRYSTLVDGEPTPPVNVIEQAVDLHALLVIGSSGYQKCLSYLWKGWLVQDEDDPASFVEYKERGNLAFWPHLDPDRMRAPIYQNAFLLLISIIYLALYTGAINTINPTGDLDFVEILLYIFTFGFIFDELTKFYKAGYHILGFWNAFNNTLYSLLMVSLALRFVALTRSADDIDSREHFNSLSYNFLAFAAPLFWGRLLLYLDSFRFFGAMLVVLKVMMKESIIFFALLIVVIVGFLQAFIGMDYADDMAGEDTLFILQAMTNAIMQSPDFTGFERFSPPFGIILYYLFTFIVMVVLLNVLIALYNSAYEDVYGNSDDEYLALFAQRTMQFVRAPDENVFIAPFNLIEIFFLLLPFEWWMPKRQYERLNDIVMAIIYSPLLFCAAIFEVRVAKDVRRNRRRGEDDDDTIEEWEQMADDIDFEGEGWAKKVDESKANVEDDIAVLEVRQLRSEVNELKGLLEKLTKSLSEKTREENLM
ncbi:putative potassium ion channel Yvc1 [Rosellinia necatrix]|uniref:Putative potassium ion channel Yvc1 n=1 Tax=Rosellinia necatrix TaxID=77044 RepID=A0A1W2TPP0_ROSNE|nr:putative potassium ion channel Yvc1 [Rosellinia necatrix]